MKYIFIFVTRIFINRILCFALIFAKSNKKTIYTFININSTQIFTFANYEMYFSLQ